jgi:hypothetical protein
MHAAVPVATVVSVTVVEVTTAPTRAGASTVAAPNSVEFQRSSLSSGSRIGLTRCMTVGDTANAAGAESTLIESWNGQAWSVAGSPATGDIADLRSAGGGMPG